MIKSYYNFRKILSYNAVYNFIVGARGLGKTYGAKVKAVKDYLNKGEEFIYLRRYKGELNTSKETFFADFAHVFPKHEFRVSGDKAQVRKLLIIKAGETKEEFEARSKTVEWETMGRFVALSIAQNYKSVSYPKVTKIIYDEFIKDKGNTVYLPNEAKAFLNFFVTVDRYKDKTIVLFLANSVAIMNPFFMEYEIRPDGSSDIISRSDGFAVAHFPDSAQFQKEVYTTRLGKFIEGTDYADYAVGNDFADNNDNLIVSKLDNLQYLMTLHTKHGTFSLSRVGNNTYHARSKRPRTGEKMFTLVPDAVSETQPLLVFGDKLLGSFRTAFRQGRITFSEHSTRNAFIEIFAR